MRSFWENGCLYFLLGVVRIFSKFGVGCIFFQYLVTNYIFCGSRKDWLHLLFHFGKFRTARGHMTRRRRPQNFGKTPIRKHIYQKTRIRCFVAVCLAAPRSFVYNCRRSSQGDSPPHIAAPPPITSGFLLALRRIRIHSGGVLLSSHRAPSHHPPLNMN